MTGAITQNAIAPASLMAYVTSITDDLRNMAGAKVSLNTCMAGLRQQSIEFGATLKVGVLIKMMLHILTMAEEGLAYVRNGLIHLILSYVTWVKGQVQSIR